MGKNSHKRRDRANTDKPTGKHRQAHPNGSATAAQAATWQLDGPYPYQDKLQRRAYEATLEKLQIELLHVQKWVKQEGQKVVIIFEGRDAAGKGGTIKRFTEHLNPRGARRRLECADGDGTRPMVLPTLRGASPHARRNRPVRSLLVQPRGVEPVMGFCTPDDYQRFIHQVSHFERALIESGIHLFKLWFDVSRQEQKRRIEPREKDPLKQWKLSPMDYESMKRWSQYTQARDALFLFTHTSFAPWTIIRSDDKKRARIGAILTVLQRLPYPVKSKEVVVPPDANIVGCPGEMTDLQGRFMFANVE